MMDSAVRTSSSPARLVAAVLTAVVLAGAAGFWVGDRGRSSTDLTVADVGFLNDMITHHDQAIEMAVSVLDAGVDPTVRAFAREVLITQRYEIGMMTAWLRDGGIDPSARSDTAMAWMGHIVPVDEMPGMASDGDLGTLDAAIDPREADVTFLRLMIEHHRGGVEMAEAAVERASHRGAVELARLIARNQRVEINEYRATQERLGAVVSPPVSESSHDGHG